MREVCGALAEEGLNAASISIDDFYLESTRICGAGMANGNQEPEKAPLAARLPHRFSCSPILRCS